MANPRRNNANPVNEYEQKRLAIIAENKRKLAFLNIPSSKTMMRPAGQSSKRTKRTHHTSAVATKDHNLRARPQRNYAENVNGQRYEDLAINQLDEDFLCDNEDRPNIPKKMGGRGITKLNDIFARTPGMPKIKINHNQYGQPFGQNCRKFSSANGCLVRKTLSVACADWRLVDAEKKYEVWTSIKAIYDIDDAAFNWFLLTAGKKWKEFKATLKEKYFDDKLTDEELKIKVGDRVTDNDWDFLIGYWKSPKSDAFTATAKDNRSKLGLHHTSGSRSFACAGHEMEKELGRPPRRDELYIRTHTRKNGIPLGQAGLINNKLKAIVEDRPELKERSIQEGDAFAVVCGEKEPRGRVRVLGLGPTPQDVGTPGLKSYTPTRLQMEVLARKKAESEKAASEQHIAAMEAEIEEERMARERQNLEITSHNGSNSRLQSHSPRAEEHIDEAHHEAQCEEEEEADEENICEEDEYSVLPRGGATVPLVPSVQPNRRNYILPARAAPLASPRNDVATCFSHDALVGQDVILYAMVRPDLVAKGTITSTNPDTVLGGQTLGTQYCEVIVNVVLKRDTNLPRPYDNMETLADAYMMPVAWPYKRLKVSKASKSSYGTTGSIGRKGGSERQ